MNSSQFNKILVVKHGSLGDIAFSILAMASIKQFFSNATIDLLTEEKYVNFLSNSNYFNSIIKDNRKGIIDSLKVILKINQNKYDVIDIKLQNIIKLDKEKFSNISLESKDLISKTFSKYQMVKSYVDLYAQQSI